MTTNPLEVCILAAGMGTRMRSTTPKMLQRLGGKPLVAHIIDTVRTLTPSAIHVVVGPEGDQIRSRYPDSDINWVLQSQRGGTGHAALVALPEMNPDARILILLGDAPLISADTLTGLLATDAALSLLTVHMKDPHGYGRIVRHEEEVLSIVEERDASESERRITEINTGIMSTTAARLSRWLPNLKSDNDQQEMLLTDIVAMARADGEYVRAWITDDPLEVTGVNTMQQLSKLERAYQKRLAVEYQTQGVYIADPARFDVRGTLDCGQDVRIDVNAIFEGAVKLGDGVVVGANCVIRDSIVEDGAVIRENTVIDGSRVGADAQVGPFARLRPGSELNEAVMIGNFVEVKNATIGRGTKASHLTYIGDANLGMNVNVGAGTITCNYDGARKHETNIADNVFIGSNTALVAPVTVGESATVAAGSTITRNVDAHELALGRSKQKTIKHWKRPT